MPRRVSYFIRRQIKFSGSVSEWESFSRRDDVQHNSWPALVRVTQAYTSQFVALIMFSLMMSEDRLSLQKRRLEIIDGLRILPGQSGQISRKHEALLCSRSVARSLSNTFFFFTTIFTILIFLLDQSWLSRCWRWMRRSRQSPMSCTSRGLSWSWVEVSTMPPALRGRWWVEMVERKCRSLVEQPL